MSENADSPRSEDVTQIRKAVSSLSWEDRKYVIVEALRTFLWMKASDQLAVTKWHCGSGIDGNLIILI
jgi:hypothetical protein